MDDYPRPRGGGGAAAAAAAGSPSSSAMPPYHHYYGSMDAPDAKGRGPQHAAPQAHIQAQQRRRRGTVAQSSFWERELVRGALFGAINASICLPASVSFATIIFRHEAFAPYLPDLVRLVLLSSAVHAAAFVGLSSMPFAVGQVQDAGLIFLSSMTTTVAEHCRARNLPDEVLLSTALVVVALATATLGLALVGIGRLGLASIVQYLPMAAVGGYLGFLGFFMGKAGLSFMTEVQLDGAAAWFGMLSDPHSLAKLAPGLGLGLGIFLVTRRVQHALTLPGCMAVAVALFYAVLAALGYSLADARALGWVAPALPPAPFYEAWCLFNFRLVQWDVLPSIIPTWLALVLVVAFSSSLDVAAIEMEIRKPLDYDHELRMIGVSNMLSGLTGGMTGSYIFSQTIFCLRNGIRGRTCAAVISLLELAAFFSPVSIISFVPRFFFGGLLVLIALDLVLEWLWASRRKMMGAEYAVALATFLAIGLTNIELGMSIGVLLALIAFAVSYSGAPLALHPRVKHSTVVRTFEERAILSANQDKVVTLPLQGYVFFGSAVRVLKAVKETVLTGHVDRHGRPFHPAILEEDEEEEEDGGSEYGAEEESAAAPPWQQLLLPSSAVAAPAVVEAALSLTPGQQQQQQQQLPHVRSNPRLVPAPFTSLQTAGAAGGGGGASSGGAGASGGNSLLVGRQSSAGSSVSSSSYRQQQPRTHRRPRSRRGSEDVQPGSIRASSLMTPVYNRGGAWIEYAENGAVALESGEARVGERDEEVGGGGGRGGGSDEEEGGGVGREVEENDEELEGLLGAMDVGDGSPGIGLGQLPIMTRSRSSRSRRSDASASSNLTFDTAAEYFDAVEGTSPPRSLSPTLLANELRQRRGASPLRPQSRPAPAQPSPERHRGGGGEGLLDKYLREWATTISSSSSTGQAPAAGGGNRIRHLVFDFEHVLGIDATAARACFLMLKSLLRAAGVRVHFAAASPPVARLLRGHGVVGEGEKLYPTLDEALEACEEALLRSAAELSREDLLGLSRHPSFYAAARRSRHLSHRALRDPTGSRRDRLEAAEEALDLESILADYLEVPLQQHQQHPHTPGPLLPPDAGGNGEDMGGVLARFFEAREFHAGQTLFRAGEASDHLYFIRKGVVELQVPPTTHAAEPGAPRRPHRLMKVSDGGSVGELGFFLKRPQAFSAVATTRCLTYALSRPGLLALAQARPQMCLLLQQAVIKSLSLASSYAIADFNGDVNALLTHRGGPQSAGDALALAE